MRMPTAEQANEKRILRSIQGYLQCERNCTAKWLKGVIGSDAPLANHLLLTQFRPYAGLPRYRELQATPVLPVLQITCEHCDIRYEIRYRLTLGLNSSPTFFQCVDCGRNFQIPGERLSVLRLNQSAGLWESVG
jgi:hypothetical protein